MDQVTEQLVKFATTYGLRVVGGIAILIAGWLAARWLAALAARATRRAAPEDETIGPIVRRVVRILVMAVTVLAVLDNFGVETTSIIAVLGAAGLAVGLALQGTLSNVASGLMLLFLRPFKVKDTVEVAGVTGTVVEIGLFTTRLKTAQGTFVYLPNAKVLSDKIHNLTEGGTRRLDLTFGIAYGDDIGAASALVQEVLAAHELVLAEPAPVVGVAALADSSVNLTCRAWVKASDYGNATLQLNRQVKERFDAANVTIPFPQRDVHVVERRAG